MDEKDDKPIQQVRGTTGGSDSGSVPLLVYISAQNTILSERLNTLLAENTTWRSGHESVHTREREERVISAELLNERMVRENGIAQQAALDRAAFVTSGTLSSFVARIETLEQRQAQLDGATQSLSAKAAETARNYSLLVGIVSISATIIFKFV